MERIKTLVTIPDGLYKENIFNSELKGRLERISDVTWNSLGRNYTSEELKENLDGIDAMICGWGIPPFYPSVLDKAGKLRFIGHAAGSVAWLCEEVYKRGIKVSSGNDALAWGVAEFNLLLTLASLSELIWLDAAVKNNTIKQFLDDDKFRWTRTESLFKQKIGFIGFGSIAKIFLEMVAIFKPEILIYDKYVSEEVKREYCNKYDIRFTSIEEVLAESHIIEVFASLTEETWHLLDKDKLSMMKDGSLLINTARGAIIDKKPLIEMLKERKIFAALDVFENEMEPFDEKK